MLTSPSVSSPISPDCCWSMEPGTTPGSPMSSSTHSTRTSLSSSPICGSLTTPTGVATPSTRLGLSPCSTHSSLLCLLLLSVSSTRASLPRSGQSMPHLYKVSQRSQLCNVKLLIVWILNGLFHSVILFWIPLLTMDNGVLWSSGHTDGYLVIGNSVFTLVVIVTCLKVMCDTSCLEIQPLNRAVPCVLLTSNINSFLIARTLYSTIFQTRNHVCMVVKWPKYFFFV